MAGCYGNDPEDRARERELDKYLDETYSEPKDTEERLCAEEAYWDMIREERLLNKEK